MSKVLSHKTKAGTTLSLRDLRGKPYLDVAQRLVWFEEENERYDIQTQFPVMNAEETIAVTTVTILNEQDKIKRRAVGVKRENQKDFNDHTEKAQTSSLGRALAMLGYGTQFTGDELDEGDRIVDSPTSQSVKSKQNAEVVVLSGAAKGAGDTSNGSRPSFKAKLNLTTSKEDEI